MAIKKGQLSNNDNGDILYPQTSYDMVTDAPDKLPANGGNADTVDSYHARDFFDAIRAKFYTLTASFSGSSATYVYPDEYNKYNTTVVSIMQRSVHPSAGFIVYQNAIDVNVTFNDYEIVVNNNGQSGATFEITLMRNDM